jgi:hypothetical protein
MEATQTQEIVTISPFEKTKEDLIAFVSDYTNLVVTEETFEESKKARATLRDMRFNIQSTEKSNTDRLNEFKNVNWARAKELIAIVSPIEDKIDTGIKAIEKAIETRKAELRAQKEREENERIQSRVNQLLAFNHAITFYDAKIMEDENFQALLGHAEADFLKEQERIADEKAEVERQRIAEQERLKVEREELERKQLELKKQEEALLMQRERELEEQRVREIKLQAERDRIQKDQEARESALRAEREKLEAEKREHQRLLDIKASEEKARIEAEEKVKREAEEKAAAEILAKEEAERQEALKTDKERIIKYFTDVLAVEFPQGEYKPESLAFLNHTRYQLTVLIKELTENINEL